FPVKLNDITRNYFACTAALSSGSMAADLRGVSKDPPGTDAVKRLSTNPYYNAILRTTCVATMLSGGHAPNALPQTDRANVNCRILPGEDPNKIKATLIKVVDDPKINVIFVEQRDADGNLIPPELVPPSPLRPELMKAVEAAAASIWGPLPIMPVMDTGASDGRYWRMAGIPTYGIAGVFLDLDNR